MTNVLKSLPTFPEGESKKTFNLEIWLEGIKDVKNTRKQQRNDLLDLQK